MKRLRNLILSLFVMGLCGAAGATWFAAHLYTKPSVTSAPIVVIIPSGAGVKGIAAALTESRVIDQPLLFQVAVRLTKQHKNLKAGEYEFQPHQTMQSVIEQIAAGRVVHRRFTVPEGLTSWQIVNLLNGVEGLSGEITVPPPEGSLLPETYDFQRGDDRAAKIAQMQTAMNKTLVELWEGRAGDLPFATPEQALVLASIVEKETGVAGERARIAGVFVNRLRQGIPLQSDPTVIYALTAGQIQSDGLGAIGRRLLKADLDIDSPYNTYKNAKLPPTPIANAGRAALEAVLHPESHNFLYFVADGSGGHVFAATLDEHNKNVAEWRKYRKTVSQ
jgi:UPF0755 protein